MRIEHYKIDTGDEPYIFEFISIDTKGVIKKRVAFQNTGINNIHNLAFGDTNEVTNQLDDTIITNNGDTTKVLATIAAIIYLFTDEYPAAIVYFTGSSPSRTRLYRMGISKHFEVLTADFEIYGETADDWEPFNMNQQYLSFLIKRKIM